MARSLMLNDQVADAVVNGSATIEAAMRGRRSIRACLFRADFIERPKLFLRSRTGALSPFNASFHSVGCSETF
jgi:hypothetical protein